MVTVLVPAGVLVEDRNVTVCDPEAARENEAGLAVTPLGNPEICTLMLPAKPLSGAAVNVAVAAEPLVISTELGAAVRVKSDVLPGGVVTGGGTEGVVPEPDPLQATSPPRQSSATTGIHCVETKIFKPGESCLASRCAP
jgi:hypothetical protein